jgi:2,3-bisphosphoglycerate-independent phosphoglycerate mutase
MFDAAVEAITHTDEAVGTVYAACQEAGYTLLVTADHGNAEQMENLETGAPHTAHTTNKVPFIMAGPKDTKFAFADDKDRKEDEEEGALCDVAPTVLALLGLDKPEGTYFSSFIDFFALMEIARRNDRPVAACCVSGNDIEGKEDA